MPSPCCQGADHFNPRSPHGERQHPDSPRGGRTRFQSTLPARGATIFPDEWGERSDPFQSTLPARGATRPQITVRASPIFQSTLPARGATTTETTSRAYMRDFNPRSPHGERPVPGAGSAARKSHFNPRSPHGERPGGQARRRNQHPISIHAPRTGSDDRPRRNRRGLRISIHAPRTGSDRIFGDLQAFAMDFNPRSPHGERRSGAGRTAVHLPISIHAPRTGSDTDGDAQAPPRKISIHAPRTGSDRRRCARGASWSNFNPRSPHGERRDFLPAQLLHRIISIHAPRTGSDALISPACIVLLFQSTLPARGATSPR